MYFDFQSIVTMIIFSTQLKNIHTIYLSKVQKIYTYKNKQNFQFKYIFVKYIF